jgi:hypothetical protein
MSTFKDFTENLMKVVLVPDESSDSVDNVQPEPPPDVFSKTATDYIDGMGDQPPCGCGEVEDDVYSEEEIESDATVNYDTNGLKVSFNGLDITIPNDVVEKIKEVLSSEETEEHEETEETEEEAKSL